MEIKWLNLLFIINSSVSSSQANRWVLQVEVGATVLSYMTVQGDCVVVVMNPACCAEGLELYPRVGSPRVFKIDFHQQKLSSLSIPCDTS